MKTRVLLLSPFFYPEPISTGRYNSFLAKRLVEKKICVDVLCFHPTYPHWRPQKSAEKLPGVSIHRGGGWWRYPKSGLLRRIVLESVFLVHLLRHAGLLRKHTHIIAVLPPMLFLPFVRLAAGPNTRITAIVHDLQGVMAGVGSRFGRSIAIGLIRMVEAMVLRCCHRVIALSKGMASFLAGAYGIPHSNIAVSPPFVTIDIESSRHRLDHLFAEGKKHVVYAGALGRKQNPEGLISFFFDLGKRNRHLICHIFSAGPTFEALRRDQTNGTGQLVFHDLVPEQDLFELYLRSHVQVIPEKIGFSAGAIPSKLPNLLASGVPILYIGQKNSDVWQAVREANAGLCTDSWEHDNLCTLVEQLLQDGLIRSHSERRLGFIEKLASVYSADALIREVFR